MNVRYFFVYFKQKPKSPKLFLAFKSQMNYENNLQK